MAAWHPIDYGFRTAPDELTLVDPYSGYFGVIRRLRFGDETWYRGVTWAEQSFARSLVGYSRDARSIALAVYKRHLNADRQKGAPNGDATGSRGGSHSPMRALPAHAVPDHLERR